MYASTNQSVAVAVFTVVPSNTVNFVRRARGIYVGGAGDVSIVDSEGTVSTFKAVPVGTIIPAEVLRVNASLTTATLMLGLV